MKHRDMMEARLDCHRLRTISEILEATLTDPACAIDPDMWADAMKSLDAAGASVETSRRALRELMIREVSNAA